MTPSPVRPARPRPTPAGALLGMLWLAALLAGCNGTTPAPTGPAVEPQAPDPDAKLPPYFQDVTAGAGIDHTYRNDEEAGHFAIPESLGGGVAMFDFDGDGLLDLFFTGGGYYEKHNLLGRPGKLYKNLGGHKFKDVTADVGLGALAETYSHGAAVGDFDNDGWPDLLVTGYGRLLLFHNVPDGKGGRRFVEIGKKAGLPAHLWSSSAAWGDLDGDGYPDLYVCQYGDWGFDTNHPTDCAYTPGVRDVCPPRKFKALPHRVFLNNRDGTFTDATDKLALRTDGKGLGVLMADLNGDGRPDLYVTNDTDDNFLYLNRGPRGGPLKLEEKGLLAGVARDDRGTPNGSMGVACVDYNGNGRPSLWCTNYENELHCLYRNECVNGREFFPFATKSAHIAAIGQNYVGWGTGFYDFDHHGWEDLFVANGHAIRFPAGKATRRQRPVLMQNEKGVFQAITGRGGSYFKEEHNGRGVAFGDLDNSGRIDVVVTHLNEPVVLLKNVAELGDNHWFGVELRGKDRRDVVGAHVLLDAGDRRQTRHAVGGGSYASTSDRRHVFGLGLASKIKSVTVQWPSGEKQEWKGLAADRYWRLVEGKAEAETPEYVKGARAEANGKAAK